MPVGSSNCTSAREWWTWQATTKALPIFCPSTTAGIVKTAIVKRMNTSWATQDGGRSSSPRRVSELTVFSFSASQNYKCSQTLPVVPILMDVDFYRCHWRQAYLLHISVWSSVFYIRQSDLKMSQSIGRGVCFKTGCCVYFFQKQEMHYTTWSGEELILT